MSHMYVSVQEQLIEQFDGILWRFYRIAFSMCFQMFVYLMIVTTLICLVSEENDFIVVLQEAQAVGFVPSDGEYIKTDLPSNRIFNSQIRKFLLQFVDELFSYLVFVVIFFESVPLLLRTVATNRGNVDEASSILDKSSPLDWDLYIRDIMQTKIYEFFQLFLSQVIFDALRVLITTDKPMSSFPLTATKPF